MLTTIHVGLGTIGREILKATAQGGYGHPLAGVDPAYAGKGLGELEDVPPLEGQVFHDLEEALALKPQVAVISTLSKVEAIADQLLQIIGAGVNIVSTCENLSYPWLKTPELADELDEAAKQAGVTVVGTGVNPGFVLDALPVMLARPCERVSHVYATRIVDTARRRRQLQLKTGGGMSEADFRAKAKAGFLGHVGLAESAALLALGLRWDLNSCQIEETIEPIMTDRTVETEHVKAGPTQAKGQHQSVTVHGEKGQRIVLTLRMELAAAEEYDEIIIEGEPDIRARIIGGVFGDSATAGCTVNILHQTVMARPGVLTVLDLPLR
jgi:2,4-diaminopentanoate dehydrogenase